MAESRRDVTVATGELLEPRYPVYVPTRSRFQYGRALTIRMLQKDRCPYRAVVVPEERDEYLKFVPEEQLLVLPDDGFRLLETRNWILDHAIAEGHARHWQLDDNIVDVRRLYKGRRIPCAAGPALRSVDDFADRYTNVGLAGLNYQMFVTAATAVPFYLNVHVYSCTQINHAILPRRWRAVYNDDTDLCLQVLADGWCTILFNVFMADKQRTMKIQGGNTNQLYEGDGRLEMARSLERLWPGVVTVDRRFQRPQHVVNWKKFDHQLERRQDVDFEALAAGGSNEYGLKLKPIRDVRSRKLREIQDGYEERHG